MEARPFPARPKFLDQFARKPATTIVVRKTGRGASCSDRPESSFTGRGKACPSRRLTGRLSIADLRYPAPVISARLPPLRPHDVAPPLPNNARASGEACRKSAPATIASVPRRRCGRSCVAVLSSNASNSVTELRPNLTVVRSGNWERMRRGVARPRRPCLSSAVATRIPRHPRSDGHGGLPGGIRRRDAPSSAASDFCAMPFPPDFVGCSEITKPVPGKSFRRHSSVPFFHKCSAPWT